MLVKDVGISLVLPTGGELVTCEVFVQTAANSFVAASYIPMIKQSTVSADYYAGNAQVDIAVSAGQNLGAGCGGTIPIDLAATFQGDVTP